MVHQGLLAPQSLWVPADKAANNVVVVCRLHYIYTLKQELNGTKKFLSENLIDGTKAYEETFTDEKSVVNGHLNELPLQVLRNA